MLSVVSIDPAGRSGQQESQDPADAAHVGRRFRRDQEAPVRTRVTHDRLLVGGEGDPADQMAHASEHHIKYGDVRLHSIRLSVKHRPHLEIVLGDPEVLPDHARTQWISFASCEEG